MTLAAAPREQTTGVLAVVQAFLTQLLVLLRSVAYRKELQRKLRTHEQNLLYGLFGAHLRHDPEFMAQSRAYRLAFLHRTGRTLQNLRAQRVCEHRRTTVTGRGYPRRSPAIARHRFERRISARRVRRYSCARVAFVPATHELLAGAPP